MDILNMNMTSCTAQYSRTKSQNRYLFYGHPNHSRLTEKQKRKQTPQSKKNHKYAVSGSEDFVGKIGRYFSQEPYKKHVLR